MLLRLFRSLMPNDQAFTERFCEHSKNIVRAAEAFQDLISETGDIENSYVEICRFEEAADIVTRDTIRAIHRTFVTPFDRSQILDLITALDDIVDLMKDAARRIRLYKLGFTPEMRGMAGCIVRAATAIRDAVPMLGAIQENAEALSAMSVEVSQIESEADDLMAHGMAALFRGEGSPGYKLTMEKIYDLIESVIDRCEDVTDVIDGIVIEQV
jgi:uncharacterized protein